MRALAGSSRLPEKPKVPEFTYAEARDAVKPIRDPLKRWAKRAWGRAGREERGGPQGAARWMRRAARAKRAPSEG